MNFKIVADSCCEFLEEWKYDKRFENVALGLEVDGEIIMDDESFDQKSFLKKVAECEGCPKSFCPSPEQYREAFDCDAEYIFVFTLSSILSGSYNAACAGRSMIMEEIREKNLPKKKIYICDSKTASGGETQLARYCFELIKEGREYGEICVKLNFFANKMRTYFVLNTMDVFKKNGRLTGARALAVSALNIKPVMAGLNGDIVPAASGIGQKAALDKMIDLLKKDLIEPAKRTIIISQCNAAERANELKDALIEKLGVKDVLIMDTRGVSSLYASDGGIIVTA